MRIVMERPHTVPTTVERIVMPYAEIILLLLLNMYW